MKIPCYVDTNVNKILKLIYNFFEREEVISIVVITIIVPFLDKCFFFTLLVTPTHKLNKRESKNLVGLMTTTLSKYLGHVLQKKNMMDMLLNNMIDMMLNNLKEWWWKDNYGKMCVLFMQCTKPKFSSNKNKDVTNIITSLNAFNIMNTMEKKLISNRSILLLRIDNL